jgi:hypothetical protein
MSNVLRKLIREHVEEFLKTSPPTSRLVPIAKRALNRGYALVSVIDGADDAQYSGIFDPSLLRDDFSLEDVRNACLGSVCLDLWSNNSVQVDTLAGFFGPLALVLAAQIDGRPIKDSGIMSPAAKRMAQQASDIATYETDEEEFNTYTLNDMDLDAPKFEKRGRSLVELIAALQDVPTKYVEEIFANGMKEHFRQSYKDAERTGYGDNSRFKRE